MKYVRNMSNYLRLKRKTMQPKIAHGQRNAKKIHPKGISAKSSLEANDAKHKHEHMSVELFNQTEVHRQIGRERKKTP